MDVGEVEGMVVMDVTVEGFLEVRSYSLLTKKLLIRRQKPDLFQRHLTSCRVR
jgi:hypothetical protein